MFHDVDLLIPRVWLGNFNSSQNLSFLKRNQINVIVNCTKDLPFLTYTSPNPSGGNDVYRYRVPVDDNLQPTEMVAMSKYLNKIIPILEKHYQAGHKIMIHCAAGIQRSAIVALSFLCVHFQCNPKTALSLMRTQRPLVFLPMMNFALSFRLSFGDNLYQLLVT
uniref:Tyrosine specific protein phosphatases domain-containing protein n=1 Tax=viral metagenome TaxID=1070528 RepID=A0A6C0BN61_9ZZZZ